MESREKECPICGTLAKEYREALFSRSTYECDNCGKYLIYDLDIPKIDRNLFSLYLYFNCKANIKEETFCYYIGKNLGFEEFKKINQNTKILTSEDVQSWYPTNFNEKINLILIALEKQSDHIGHNIQLSSEQIKSLFFINRFVNKTKVADDNNNSQINLIANYLTEQKLIEKKGNIITILPEGWKRIDELQKNQSINNQEIIAMSFDSKINKSKDYQIALSFAGEDRKYVDEVAYILKSKGVSVFYDLYEEANFWGKNLYDYLTDVYQNKALYTIMFISKYYAKKLWTNHERQSMQVRAFQENQEYILPARFDDTIITGILPTTGYIDLRNKTAKEFSEIIINKIILSGESVPSEKKRKAFYTYNPIPKSIAFDSCIIIKNTNGLPLQDITVTAIADNATYKQSNTNENGVAIIDIQTRRNYTVLVSNKNYPGIIIEKWNPTNDLEITLQDIDKIGSVICHSTCYIPELNGRLNIILDSSFRTYLYADNISINGGTQQPATFDVGVPFSLEDANGTIMEITVKYINGVTSLVEYFHN